MGEVASVERVPASLLPRRPLPVKCSCVWAWRPKAPRSPAKTTPALLSGGQRPQPSARFGNDDHMITAGVDLSSQTAHTASCMIEWSGQSAIVTDLEVDVDDRSISALAQTVDKLGIDVPLGWPLAFAEAVAQHSRQGSWPVDYT